MSTSQSIAQKVYGQDGAGAGAAAPAGAGAPTSGGDQDDNVIDADFEVK